MEPKFLPQFEKPETETPSFPEEMYAVSGFEAPNKDHYQKSKRFDEAIAKEVSLELKLKDRNHISKDALSQVIDEILETGKPHVRLKAIQQFHRLDDESFVESVKKVVQNNSTDEEKTACFRNIHTLSPESQKKLLDDLALLDDSALQIALLRIADTTLSQEEKTVFIKERLSSPSASVRASGLRYIDRIPEKEIGPVIRAILEFESDRVRVEALEFIHQIPIDEQKSKLAKLFQPFFQLVLKLPDTTRLGLMQTALASTSESVQKAALDQLPYISSNEHDALIALGIQSHFPNIRTQAISKNYRSISPKTLRSLVETDSDPGVRSEALHNLCVQASHDEEITLVTQYIQSNQPELQKAAARRFHTVPLKERELLIQDPFILELIIQSPLYDKHLSLDDENFARASFDKTGSGTTLIGGALKDKVIIRHITPEAFLNWQKAYENWEEWDLAEFDYVPIEPIQSYRLNKEGLVDVASGVLDLSLSRWKTLFPHHIFNQELTASQDQIERSLEVMGINHGHPHEDNFVLKFFRKEDGSIDLSRCPRLYLIDFDQAKS